MTQPDPTSQQPLPFPAPAPRPGSIATVDDANKALCQIRDAQAQVQRIKETLDAEVAKLTEKAAQDTAPHLALIEAQVSSLFEWATSNREQLVKPKTKMIELVQGILRWMESRVSVVIEDEEKAKKSIRRQRFVRFFLRKKEEISKTLLKKDPERAKKIAGIKFVGGEEENFLIEINGGLEPLTRKIEELLKLLSPA